VSSRLNPLPAIRSQIVGGLVTVARDPTLRFLCLLTGLLSFAYMPTLQLWPTQMKALSGEGTWLMGWVWAALNLAAVLGSWALPRLLARAERPKVALAVTMLRSASLATAALAGGFGKALVGLIGQSAGTGASDPLLGAWMNELAASHQRATVLSIQAMSFMLGGSAGLVCLGIVARSAGVAAAWLGGAFALLVGALLILRRGRRDAVATTPAGDLA
jgi:MFS family permease